MTTDRQKCTARSKSTGEQCKNWPITGATVCRLHGGSAKNVRAAAARRVAEKAAAEAVATYGLPIDITPTEALLQEVRHTAGHVEWLRQRVREVEESKLTVGVTEQKIDPEGGKSVKVESVPNAWVRLYQEERKHLVAVSAAALRAGVEERLVRLEERQGALVGEVIGRILDALELNEAQQARVPELLRAQFRVLAGGGAV